MKVKNRDHRERMIEVLFNQASMAPEILFLRNSTASIGGTGFVDTSPSRAPAINK